MSQTVTSNLDTTERAGQVVNLPIAASVHIYAGTLLAIVTSSGFVTFAGDDAGKVVVGRAEQEVDNSLDGAGGALSVPVKRGTFLFQNSSRSSGAYALTADNVGQLCYVENEQTVQVIAGSTNKIVAGVFLGIDPTTLYAVVDTTMGMASGAAEGLALTQNAITDNSGGTAATPSAGNRTIAVIAAASTDTSAAQKVATANAIAGLIAELALVKADLAALKSAI